MITERPVSERVKNIRERVRTTAPKLDLSRYKLITDFYRENPQLTGILKRAKNLRNLFENMPTLISEGELIVGWQGTSFRDSPLYPEVSWDWFMEELRSNNIRTRRVDPYELDEEDEKYLLETGDYWLKNNMSVISNEYMPRKIRDELAGNGVVSFGGRAPAHAPVGHFTANFWTATRKGFGAIRDEARAKIAYLEEHGIFGEDAEKYSFYRAVDIVCEGIIIWAKRYSGEAERLAGQCCDPVRKAELLDIAERMNHIIEKPCRTFHDAIQCVWFYQIAMCMDAQLHGISFGRMDQYLGSYYEKDLAEGRITEEKAQELVDLFMLKVAEVNKIWSEGASMSNPGYTAGMLITLGGVDMEGRDASNPVTYMFLHASRRLSLNCPQALRVHEGTPMSLWETAIECTKVCGGIPTYESDKAIIPAMMARGIPLEYARNYCLEGCVEPTIGGYEWGQPGGDGAESYINITNAMLMAINNGINPLRPADAVPQIQGPATGYLYEMNSMEEVLAAVKAQFEFWMPWHANCTNMWETMAAFHRPLPLVSACYTGCMESGKDVMCGGAMFNSTGNSCIGIGNVADSLNCIDQICFKKKIATTRELYDALMANWEGYEELRQIINGAIPRFGNGDPECDKYMTFTANAYADAINRCIGTRGNHYCAGCYPVTLNVVFGYMTGATPDGRKRGEPLADGISPVQGMDKNGPVSTLNSLLTFDYTKYGNGTLCNMKFHPTALASEEGLNKLVNVMRTYFDRGGMELQLNIIGGDTLRKAQENPSEYRDLVVRIAGFSAYFVEVFKDMQDDLIRRTEMSL
ncbi:MAG: hypothetical protein MJ067_04150 [Oscillospiraceae bacterium]|nr:hypothetical protein [Oscillospiraceae bacterium]